MTVESEGGGSAPAWKTLRVAAGGDPAAREAASEALFAAGSMGVYEDGETLVTHFPPEVDADAARDAVLRAVPGARVEITDTPDVNWSERWRDRIHAHDLGALTVMPPWLAEGADPRRTVIIEPEMAFGTGEHATTRGVVRLMQEIVRPGDTVADLGAGSAILSIAAVKLGAARAVAIELDPESIGNAEENVVRNDVVGRVQVIEGDATTLLPLIAPVRVVLANIISSVLETLLPVIEAALTPDGAVILSGILQEERAHMLRVLDAGGWRVIREDSEDVWWSVSIARR